MTTVRNQLIQNNLQISSFLQVSTNKLPTTTWEQSKKNKLLGRCLYKVTSIMSDFLNCPKMMVDELNCCFWHFGGVFNKLRWLLSFFLTMVLFRDYHHGFRAFSLEKWCCPLEGNKAGLKRCKPENNETWTNNRINSISDVNLLQCQIA